MFIDHQESNNHNSENQQSSNSEISSESIRLSESSPDQNNEEAKAIQENRPNREDSFHLNIHNQTMAVLNDEHAGLN